MTVASPCVKVCAVSEADGLCVGCLRTLDEIARWSVMHDEDRRRIVADLSRRGGVAPPAGG